MTTTTTFTSILIEQTTTTTSSIDMNILSQLIKVNLGKIVESTGSQITIEFPFPVYRNAFTMQAMFHKIPFFLDGDHYLVVNL